MISLPYRSRSGPTSAAIRASSRTSSAVSPQTPREFAAQFLGCGGLGGKFAGAGPEGSFAAEKFAAVRRMSPFTKAVISVPCENAMSFPCFNGKITPPAWSSLLLSCSLALLLAAQPGLLVVSQPDGSSGYAQ